MLVAAAVPPGREDVPASPACQQHDAPKLVGAVDLDGEHQGGAPC